MPKPTSPLPTDDLNDNAAYPFGDQADEIVLRVSSYNFDTDPWTPTSYQAIVRHRDRTKCWGVGIRSNPVAALSAAIADFYKTRDRLSNSQIAGIENDIRTGAKYFDEMPEPEVQEPETGDPDIEDLLS